MKNAHKNPNPYLQSLCLDHGARLLQLLEQVVLQLPASVQGLMGDLCDIHVQVPRGGGLLLVDGLRKKRKVAKKRHGRLSVSGFGWVNKNNYMEDFL
jgi:hypothetical protein